MDYFTSFAVLLLVALVTWNPVAGSFGNAYEFNNTAVFTKIIPSNNISTRDPIYITPELMFVGKSNGDIMRCLFKDPSICELFYSYTSSTRITAIAMSGEYLYASLADGVMLRCFLHKKGSCMTFNNMNQRINGLAVSSAGLIYAGLKDGQMLRCELHQPNKCKTINNFGSEITSITASEKYIYAGLMSKEIWRCSISSENSCRRIDSTDCASEIIGMTAVEETVIGVTSGGTIWKCTRGSPCTYNSLATAKSIAAYKNSLYVLDNPRIRICHPSKLNCSFYDQPEGASTFSFSYGTYKMQDKFVNEEKTCVSGAPCPPYVVYYEINQRSALAVFVKGGRLYNSRGILVDTTNADLGYSGRAAIFAMGANGQILLSNVHNSMLRTSSFFAGQPVASAGEMVVEAGVIKTIRACDDHYQPDAELNQQVVDALYMKGYTARIDSLSCCNDNKCAQMNNEVTIDSFN